MCPFCECTLTPQRDRGAGAARGSLITQRAVLSFGFVFFSVVAIICMIAAFVVYVAAAYKFRGGEELFEIGDEVTGSFRCASCDLLVVSPNENDGILVLPTCPLCGSEEWRSADA